MLVRTRSEATCADRRLCAMVGRRTSKAGVVVEEDVALPSKNDLERHTSEALDVGGIALNHQFRAGAGPVLPNDLTAASGFRSSQNGATSVAMSGVGIGHSSNP